MASKLTQSSVVPVVDLTLVVLYLHLPVKFFVVRLIMKSSQLSLHHAHLLQEVFMHMTSAIQVRFAHLQRCTHLEADSSHQLTMQVVLDITE